VAHWADGHERVGSGFVLRQRRPPSDSKNVLMRQKKRAPNARVVLELQAARLAVRRDLRPLWPRDCPLAGWPPEGGEQPQAEPAPQPAPLDPPLALLGQLDPAARQQTHCLPGGRHLLRVGRS
jgi:hypothetical protein